VGPRRYLLAAFTIALAFRLPLIAVARQAPSVQEDPATLVRAYWNERDADARSTLARRLASLPDCRPARLREWIHGGAPYDDLAPGTRTIAVDAGAEGARPVTLVLPEGYRRDRAWPLVYALHPSGEPADRWAGQVQRMLGVRAREVVIASPEYRQNYIAVRPPFVAEHAAILDAVARVVHVDANRVYAFGYSKGGFAAWYAALYFADRFAGAVALAAGFDVAPGDDGFWKQLAPNVAHVPVLNAWGELDPLVIRDLAEKPAGTFAESNRWFARELRGMSLPITNIEVPGGVHNQLAPPGEAIADILNRRRAVDPPSVKHTFRHLHQSSSYWVEGLTWAGDSWGDPWPPRAAARPGESEAAVLARTFEPLLGRLTGVREGQAIRVTRRHIGDIVVWLGERSINWDQPVTVECDGRVVFSGRVAQDAELALARAKATMDFERLVFAGIRVSASGEASVVTAATMPDPAWKR
jgi:pimeloyl-ACP methyl ester carboxylesterase